LEIDRGIRDMDARPESDIKYALEGYQPEVSYNPSFQFGKTEK
jgi:hypothetical protein